MCKTSRTLRSLQPLKCCTLQQGGPISCNLLFLHETHFVNFKQKRVQNYSGYARHYRRGHAEGGQVQKVANCRRHLDVLPFTIYFHLLQDDTPKYLIYIFQFSPSLLGKPRFKTFILGRRWNTTHVAYSHLYPVHSKFLVSNHPMYQSCVQCNSHLTILILNISIFWTLCFLFIFLVTWTRVSISRTDEICFRSCATSF